MNTQGIRSNDSWAQFVKLAQEARNRNQSLSAQAAQKQQSSQPVRQFTMQENNEKAAPRAEMPKASAFAIGEPKTKTKVLGNFFDAYA